MTCQGYRGSKLKQKPESVLNQSVGRASFNHQTLLSSSFMLILRILDKTLYTHVWSAMIVEIAI